MPKAHVEQKSDKFAEQKKIFKPIPSRLIDFTPRSQTQSIQNRYSQKMQKIHLQSNQLNKKINKMLRLSFRPGNKSGEQLNLSTQRINMSLGDGIQSHKDANKQQVFSIPKIIKNINSRLSPCSQNISQANVSSNRKLFKEEQEYLNKLKNKAKISNKKIISELVSNKNAEPIQASIRGQQCQKSQTQHTKKFQRSTIKQSFSNRSKTMNVQSQNCPQNSFELSSKKIPIQSGQQKIMEQPKSANQYYQKFQSYCKVTQNYDQSLNKNRFIPTNIANNKIRSKSPSRKFSRRHERLTDINKAYQPESQKNKSKQPFEQLKDTIKKEVRLSQSPQHGSNLIGQSRTHLNVMIKSNSNNKGLNREQRFSGQKRLSLYQSKQSREIKKRVINYRPQETYSSQTIKFINLTSYEQNNNRSEEKDVNFSWRAERIHHPSSQKIEMNRTESRKSTKKTKYLHFQRNMKLSNNIHIVITESNKTKINIFHNSLLLKEDPQKVEALTSLVRDASKLGNGQHKIEVPLELEINKLKIQEKNNQLSGRESRKEIQTQLREGIRKEKQKRKQSVPRTRTERKYQIVMEDVKPWDINYQGDIQQSHHTALDDSDFSYLNSKTIS